MRNFCVTCLVVFFFLQTASAQKTDIKKAFDHAAKQTSLMLVEVQRAEDSVKPNLFSPRTIEDGRLQLVPSKDWTSGFFPGVLWFLYEYTGSSSWVAEAKKFTSKLEKEKMNAGTHDMGFKIYSSFGNGYKLNNDPHYREVLIQAAKTLSTRFNHNTGVIRSWDHNKEKWVNPTIIDNMLNLELLFEASKLTGDSSFYKVAVSHANTTMRNHFRADYSSYHVVDYDPMTGLVLKKTTHQGYNDESAWARGQAWALYGFTMCYRYTKDPAYLKQAEHVANFIINHPNMPEDLVPYWDFNAPDIPNEPRDASAASVIASGLYELSTYSNKDHKFVQIADKVLNSLSVNYIAPAGGSKGFILLHSTGSKPSGSEVDVPLSYADYYYLEALLRKKNIHENKPVLSVEKLSL